MVRHQLEDNLLTRVFVSEDMFIKKLFIACLLLLTIQVSAQLYIPNHDYETKAYFEELDVKGTIVGHHVIGNFVLDALPDTSYNSARVSYLYKSSLKVAPIVPKFFPDSDLNFDIWFDSKAYTIFGQKTSYVYQSEDTRVMISPVIHATINRDQIGGGFMNSRGMEIKGTIDGKVSFYTLVTDNQISMPRYINEKIVLNQFTMPGETWLKAFKAGETNINDLSEIGTVDFFQTRAYINFKVSKSIDLQFGQDKNKLGYGYRSLVLSDNAAAYPFLKLETKMGNVKYQNLFMELNNWPHRTTNALIQKKYFASHTVSWNVNNNLNLSLFENIMYARADTGAMAHLEWQYMNPIIFYRAAEHGLGSPDNASLGLMGKYDLLKTAKIYGQFYLDDINFQTLKSDFIPLMKRTLTGNNDFRANAVWTNKWATQIGAKYYDVAKINHLDMQLEVNWVKPYTYSHRDIRQAYIHNAQALAHPLGSNFRESLMLLSYRFKEKWQAEIKIFNVVGGTDTANSNWGSDVNKNYWNPGPDYLRPSPDPVDYQNSVIGRGVNYQLNSASIYIGYEIKYNLIIEIEVKQRRLKSEIDVLNLNDLIIQSGIRWNIGRKYYDF